MANNTLSPAELELQSINEYFANKKYKTVEEYQAEADAINAARAAAKDPFNTKTTMGNVSLGQPLKISNTSTNYAEPPDAADNQAASLKDVREKFAPNADKQTTASGSVGVLDINSVLQAVDPFGLSSILPGMLSGLSEVNSTMNAAAPSTKKTIVQNSLYGALCNLSKKYTFERVITVFDTALANGGMQQISSNQRSVVSHALTYLIKNANDNGPDNIKIPFTFTQVTEIGNTVPTPVTNLVPDLYKQVYYKIEKDPYPGYKKWLSNDKKTAIYTQRVIGEYYYETADDEIYNTSVIELTADLDPYCDPEYLDPITNLPLILTATIINDFIIIQNTNVENNSMEKTLGTGSSGNLMDNLGSLMGYTGTIVDSMQSSLVNSVLNQSSISSSLSGYSKNIAMLKSMKSSALTAFKPASLVNSLFSEVSSLQNVVGNLQSKGLSAIGGSKVLNLANNIKSFT